eukprot:tig00020610_g11952.t1
MSGAAPASERPEFIETKSGNRIARSCVIVDGAAISIEGKSLVQPDCVLRADLGPIRIGRNCILGRGVLLQPSRRAARLAAGAGIVIGDHTIFGEGTVVQAAAVGSFCDIGRECVLAEGCVLKDCCKVLDGTILAPETVIPPFQIFGGIPGHQVGELPESMEEVMRDRSSLLYREGRA